jgi:hypothetical protein
MERTATVEVEIESSLVRRCATEIVETLQTLPSLQGLDGFECTLVQSYVLGMHMAAAQMQVESWDAGIKALAMRGMRDFGIAKKKMEEKHAAKDNSAAKE